MLQTCFEAFEFLNRRPLSRGRVSRMCLRRKWTNHSRFSESEPGSVRLIHKQIDSYIAKWICYPIEEVVHQTSRICNSTYVLAPHKTKHNFRIKYQNKTENYENVHVFCKVRGQWYLVRPHIKLTKCWHRLLYKSF